MGVHEKEGRKEGRKEARKEVGKEGGKKSGKEGRKEERKEGRKEGRKDGSKEGIKRLPLHESAVVCGVVSSVCQPPLWSPMQAHWPAWSVVRMCAVRHTDTRTQTSKQARNYTTSSKHVISYVIVV